MSFVYLPSTILIPRSPILDYDYGLWVGRDDDNGICAFCVWGAYENWIMSTEFAPDVLIDDYRLSPVYTNINGYMCWQGSGRFLYRSRAYGSFIMSDQFLGFEPLEKYNRDEEKYEGDSFYIIKFPNTYEEKGTATPRGCLRNKEDEKTLEVSLEWSDCWTSEEEFGEYLPLAPNTEKPLHIGLPTWEGSDGETYTKSLTKDGKGYYTYGRAFYNPYHNVWMIGEYNSPNGWWESSSEPTAPNDCSFKFTIPDGMNMSQVEKKDDITLKFETYTQGNNIRAVFIGEVSRWN